MVLLQTATIIELLGPLRTRLLKLFLFKTTNENVQIDVLSNSQAVHPKGPQGRFSPLYIGTRSFMTMFSYSLAFKFRLLFLEKKTLMIGSNQQCPNFLTINNTFQKRRVGFSFCWKKNTSRYRGWSSRTFKSFILWEEISLWGGKEE